MGEKVNCSKCGKLVIDENGKDIRPWICLNDIYTCAYCKLGVEEGSIEAKVILGPLYSSTSMESMQYGDLTTK